MLLRVRRHEQPAKNRLVAAAAERRALSSAAWRKSCRYVLQVRELEECLHSLAVLGAWHPAADAPPLTAALLRAARSQMLGHHAVNHFQLLRIVWSVAAMQARCTSASDAIACPMMIRRYTMHACFHSSLSHRANAYDPQCI